MASAHEGEISGSKAGITAVVMVAALMAMIDITIVNVALSDIRASFGTPIDQIGWVSTGYMMANIVIIPMTGWFQRRFGFRRYFAASVLLFTTASVLCGLSWNLTSLVLFRALQGLGGGALLTMPYGILADVVPPRDRPKYAALVTVVWTVAGLLGPPLGGFIADGPGWRWMFYLNVPAAIVSFALLQWGYRIPVRRLEHRVDFAGAGLLFFAVGSLILYSSWAGKTLGWTAWPSLGLLATSGLLALAFVRWERRAPEPIVELSIFRGRAVWAPLLTTFLYGLGNFAITFMIPLFGLVVRGTSAVEAGLGLMPLTSGLLLSSIVLGRVASTTQRFRRYAMGGLCVYGAGIALLATAGPETSRLQLWSYTLLLGLGSGPLNPVLISSLQNAVDPRHLGVASSLPGFSRTVAQSIGSSAFGTLLALRFAHHLAAGAGGDASGVAALERLAGTPEAIRALEEPLRSAVVGAYASAFSESFVAMFGLVVLTLAASRFMVDPHERTGAAAAGPTPTAGSPPA